MFQLAFDYALKQDGPDVVADWLRDLARQVQNDEPTLIVPVDGRLRIS